MYGGSSGDEDDDDDDGGDEGATQGADTRLPPKGSIVEHLHALPFRHASI